LTFYVTPLEGSQECPGNPETAVIVELGQAVGGRFVRDGSVPTPNECGPPVRIGHPDGLEWLEKVRGAKPSTTRSHQSDLAEPGTPHKRGTGTTAGLVMAALGDRPAAKITPAEVDALLRTVAATDVSARSVNRVREIVCAAFNYGMKPTTYWLPTNPALGTDRRRVPEPGVLLFYSFEEIDVIARSLEAGFHRPVVTARDELERFEDHRDSEAVRVAAYSGLRLGELLALPWRDVDWTGSALTISRTLSSGVEGTTKTGHVRRVPMADQAAAALDRLSQRQDFVSPDDYVFCNALGRPLDGSALRRRYKRARDAAGLRPLRWHDLRHTFGSLLVAGGVDLVSIKDAMGHSQLTTTSRHSTPGRRLSARPRSAAAPTRLRVPDTERVSSTRTRPCNGRQSTACLKL
jgi:integrase